MAAINFPDPLVQTTFGPKTSPAATSNGVTYVWTNGTWSILNADAPDFIDQDTGDARYVNVNGDNMSNLTLGPQDYA